MKYLLVGVLIFLACKATLTPEQKEMEKACLKLEDTLKIFWKYDSLKQHHIDNPKSPFFLAMQLKDNKYKKCIESKDTAFVIRLFGKHYRYEATEANNRFAPNKLVYMLTKYPCVGRGNDYKCKFLEFYFTNDGEITFLGYHDISSSSSH